MSGSETVSQGPAEHRAGVHQVRLGTAAAVGVALLVASWLGGGWWQDRQAAAPATGPVPLEFVLESVDVHQQDPQSPGSRVAEVSGFLVNTGPQPVFVRTFSWGGKVAGGQFTVPAEAVGPVLTSTSPVACTPPPSPSPDPLVMPDAQVRGRTGAGAVTDMRPRIVNPAAWELTIIRQCLTPAPVDASGVVSVSPDFSASLVGQSVVVSLRMQNPGGAPVVASPGLDADGFGSVATPAQVTVQPGQSVAAVIRVTVRNCGLARTGEVRALTFNPTDQVVPPPGLVRALDRLVARACGGL